MAKIIINRKNEWMNRARAYKIFIDGEQQDPLKHGATGEYVVDAGLHIVECKVDWCRSNKLNLHVNETGVSMLKVESGMKYYWPVYFFAAAAFLLPLAFKAITNTPLPSWLQVLRFVVIGIMVLYVIYYVTIGRDKYLILKEDDTSIFS